MAEIKNRLMQYAALAAAIPAAGADAGIISDSNLDLVILPGESALIDFGAGFGQVFRFEVRTGSFDRASGLYNALFQFNDANSGNVDTAGFVAEQFSIPTSSGGSYLITSNDPQRLASGNIISIERPFYDPMTSAFGTSHDLAGSSASAPVRANGFGDWYPDVRGFIGFKMFKDGSFHFGWFDVETIGWGNVPRVAGPILVIHGWGFQDEFRVPIKAGEVPAPAAGGLLALALGAAGVRRSRELSQVA